MKTLGLMFMALCCLPSLPAQAPRWVVVDFQKVFESYRDLQLADADMKREIQAFRQEQAVRIEGLNAKKQEFLELREQAAADGISEEDRTSLVEQATALFEQLRATEQELQQEQTEFNQQAEAKIGRLRREMADRVSSHLDRMARERGWDLVLDSSANGVSGLPVVQYADPTLDKTVDVINSLNAAAAEEAGEEEADAEAVSESSGAN
jgi:Skp family chaperone for outer membrane proteins